MSIAPGDTGGNAPQGCSMWLLLDSGLSPALEGCPWVYISPHPEKLSMKWPFIFHGSVWQNK